MILRKITIEIDAEDYIVIVNSLHHGQLSALIRLFMKNLVHRFKHDKKADLYQWLYGKESITFNPTKELTDDS